MKNMKRWKRLLAVGMCSAMMFSMSVGVSATENQDTEETTVAETQEEEETAPDRPEQRHIFPVNRPVKKGCL